MSEHGVLEERKISRLLVLAIVGGFVTVLVISALFYVGFLGLVASDLQNLVQAVFAINGPSPATDVVHFGLGFGIAIAGYTAATYRATGRRTRITLDSGRRASRAADYLFVISVSAFLLIVTKEFWFDVFFENQTASSGLVDLGTYIVGFLLGISAMLWGEA